MRSFHRMFKFNLDSLPGLQGSRCDYEEFSGMPFCRWDICWLAVSRIGGIGHLLAAKPPHGLTIPRKTCHCSGWLADNGNLAATHVVISGWLVLAWISVLDWLAHNILQFKLRSYSWKGIKDFNFYLSQLENPIGLIFCIFCFSLCYKNVHHVMGKGQCSIHYLIY